MIIPGAPSTAGDTAILRGPYPELPEHNFSRRPGLAEQIAQLVEAYDALVEDGHADVAARLAAKGDLFTQGQLDWATEQARLGHRARSARLRRAQHKTKIERKDDHDDDFDVDFDLF